MPKNTSISLDPHFEDFIQRKIRSGRFHSASEVIRAGLRLLEEEENKVQAIRKALEEGEDSGFVSDFDPTSHLQSLHQRKNEG